MFEINNFVTAGRFFMIIAGELVLIFVAVSFIVGMKASPQVHIVHINQALDAQAWQLFIDRTDKEWTLVDCTSFVVMQQLGLSEAFTTDHHFEEAGFVTLLKG